MERWRVGRVDALGCLFLVFYVIGLEFPMYPKARLPLGDVVLPFQYFSVPFSLFCCFLMESSDYSRINYFGRLKIPNLREEHKMLRNKAVECWGLITAAASPQCLLLSL